LIYSSDAVTGIKTKMTWNKPRKARGARSTGLTLGASKGNISGSSGQIKEIKLTFEEMLEIGAERETANLLISKNESSPDGKSIFNKADK